MIYLIIFFAKIIENALSTLRLIVVANGKKIIGAILQIFVTFVWVVIASMVIIDIKSDYFKVIAFILGSAIGSYLGSLIEEHIAMGTNLLICIVNPDLKNNIVNSLKLKNFKIINFNDSEKLIILTKRKKRKEIIKIIKNIDKGSIIIASKVLFD